MKSNCAMTHRSVAVTPLVDYILCKVHECCHLSDSLNMLSTLDDIVIEEVCYTSIIRPYIINFSLTPNFLLDAHANYTTVFMSFLTN